MPRKNIVITLTQNKNGSYTKKYCGYDIYTTSLAGVCKEYGKSEKQVLKDFENTKTIIV